MARQGLQSKSCRSRSWLYHVLCSSQPSCNFKHLIKLVVVCACCNLASQPASFACKSSLGPSVYSWRDELLQVSNGKINMRLFHGLQASLCLQRRLVTACLMDAPYLQMCRKLYVHTAGWQRISRKVFKMVCMCDVHIRACCERGRPLCGWLKSAAAGFLHMVGAC